GDQFASCDVIIADRIYRFPVYRASTGTDKPRAVVGPNFTFKADHSGKLWVDVSEPVLDGTDATVKVYLLANPACFLEPISLAIQKAAKSREDISTDELPFRSIKSEDIITAPLADLGIVCKQGLVFSAPEGTIFAAEIPLTATMSV